MNNNQIFGKVVDKKEPFDIKKLMMSSDGEVIDIDNDELLDPITWKSDEAFARFKAIRDTKKFLKRRLNDNNSGILPLDCKKKYQETYRNLKELEKMELKNIEYGR